MKAALCMGSNPNISQKYKMGEGVANILWSDKNIIKKLYVDKPTVVSFFRNNNRPIFGLCKHITSEKFHTYLKSRLEI